MFSRCGSSSPTSTSLKVSDDMLLPRNICATRARAPTFLGRAQVVHGARASRAKSVRNPQEGGGLVARERRRWRRRRKRAEDWRGARELAAQNRGASCGRARARGQLEAGEASLPPRKRGSTEQEGASAPPPDDFFTRRPNLWPALFATAIVIGDCFIVMHGS